MLMSRVLARLPRTVAAHCRTSVLISPPKRHFSSIISNHFVSARDSSDKLVTRPALHHLAFNASSIHRCGLSSSASPQPTENQSGKENDSNIENKAPSTNAEPASGSTDAKTKESGSTSESQSPSTKRRRGTKRTAFSDSESDSDGDLTMDDLVKLVTEKEELLKSKQKEIEKMQDKVLRTYAEMENVMDRTKREAENSKKFAIQNFAKNLLDVADNLGRASTVVKDSFSKIDVSKDSAGAVPLLKTLLEGVEMTDKQLTEVFRKFGVEKYDPTNEQFDPHRHNAQFQIPDGTKPPGTVAAVLKVGYTLGDRVIRPADVGVTVAVENSEAADRGSEA